MIQHDSTTSARAAMYNENALKIGLFGANCSSGRYVTTVPERWSGSWDDNLLLAQMADDAGIDFLLPIGRWKGYGGSTDHQGATYETLTWAAGLLASTKRITVFGTVHAPLFNPIIASKQMVTADHIGHGRFGLNVVCGWNEGEFDMFGVPVGEHSDRYAQGQEWLDVVKRTWTDEDFDVAGQFFQLRGVREKPKPYGETRPLIMNAGSSGDGRAFALRNCDAFFTTVRTQSRIQAGVDEAAAAVAAAKAEARSNGREIEVYTVGIIVCRPTRAEAEDYHRYCTDTHADWDAVNNMLAMKGLLSRPPEELEKLRRQRVNGASGLPLIGSPDDVAAGLQRVSEAGFRGIAVSFVNYAAELPYFRDEVLPRLERLGLRETVR
jgi:alkanesulfonate monooxygenase SsuD/methylene tetrahydromethanopterin reductase-like flavin-dependent oxidoreductase (luciferase family)